MELNPDDLRVQMNLAEAYALNGRIDEALLQLRRSFRNLPENHPQRRLILDRIKELELKRPQKARALIRAHAATELGAGPGAAV